MHLLKNSTNQKNWTELYRDSIKKREDLNLFFDINLETLNYPIFIPKSFAKKIKKSGPDSPLWKQFIPNKVENNKSLFDHIDPIGDHQNAKGSGIIHRYKNRILFTPTVNCPIICRYCFRKNELYNQDDIFKQNLNQLIDYLTKNSEINEVILTGGDPLVLSNQKIDLILEMISSTQVKFVRFHTRTPIILPERIDDGFVQVLEKYSQIFTRLLFVLHTNHADEIDDDVYNSLKKLKNLPIDKLTQSVLLNGVNNNEVDLFNLFSRIIDCHFTPYYLHHPDLVKGGMHFYLPIEEGRVLYSKLRNKLPGWGIPHYIIDHPNGHGKQLAFNPESTLFSGKFLNLNNVEISYPIEMN